MPDPALTLAWFDAEHAGLLAAQQLARRHGWDTQVCHLAWALDPYHRRRGSLEDQAASWQLAVTCAQRLDDPAIRIQAHQMLGDAYAQLSKTTDALHHLGRALTLAERAGDSVSLGEIHHSLGGSWERHGDDRRALEHAEQAVAIFRRLDNTFRLARALNGVGWLQSRLGDYAQARANCQAALALFRHHRSGNSQLGESATLDSLGYIAYRSQEYDAALDYYQQALAICRGLGHTANEAYVLCHVAETLLAQQRPELARDAWQQARELYAAQHRPTDVQAIEQQLSSLDGTGPAQSAARA
jgi:tetratricopeptide (TPR) repeat protein